MATTNAATPQNIIIEPGSLGGREDLFNANESRAMARTVVAVAQMAGQNNWNLPRFQSGVDMEITDAYRWIESRLPTLAGLTFWCMAGGTDGERFRTWVYALRRHGCKEDCNRTLKNYIDKMFTVCKAVFVMSSNPNTNTGI